MAHGYPRLLRELHHPPLDLQVPLPGEGLRYLVDDSEYDQILQDVPVEDGELLREADVPEEVARLLVAQPRNVSDEPLPGRIGVGEPLQDRPDGQPAVSGELTAGGDDPPRLRLGEPDAFQLPHHLASAAAIEEAAAPEPFDGGPADPRPGLGRQQAEGELREEVLVRPGGPDPPEVGEAASDLLLCRPVEGYELFDSIGVHRSSLVAGR